MSLDLMNGPSSFSDASFCDHLRLLIKEPLLQIWDPQEPLIRSVSQPCDWAHAPDSHSLIHSLSLTHPGVYLTLLFIPLLFQWFPDATMTTVLRSIFRGASEWTTRKLAPSSSPSACPSMTTSPRLWETNGCRLYPSLPPALPHPPAAQVSLTPPLTATAQISPTKSPSAAHRRLPAAGLSIKSETTSDMRRNCDFLLFPVCSSACRAMEMPVLVLCGRASRFSAVPLDLCVSKCTHWCRWM